MCCCAHVQVGGLPSHLAQSCRCTDNQARLIDLCVECGLTAVHDKFLCNFMYFNKWRLTMLPTKNLRASDHREKKKKKKKIII